MLHWKFYQDPTSENLSWLHLSSKSFPGVFEDRDILDGTGDGLRVLNISKGSFTQVSSWSLSRLTFPPSLFFESWRTGMFLVDLVMVLLYSKYPREALLWVSAKSSIRKLLKTLSFHMSSKSFTGVLEDRDVLDGAGDGVRVLRIPLESFAESFIEIHYQEPSQD